ncbi:MAG: hypothetical protein GF334_12790 [Candidatus Altiarchaeales archaeon]|nr:hypothetical protein [Candidatus Altiarchaeales archaeon]
MPDYADDIALIREKYTPETYDNQSINVGEALGLSIGSIKQMSYVIDEQEAKIAELEKRIEELEKG